MASNNSRMVLAKQLELGFRTYFEAVRFIFRHHLWWVFLFPVAMNILLFLGGYALIGSYTTGLQDWVTDKIGMNGTNFPFSEFIGAAVGILIKVLFFLLFAVYGGYIVLIVLSPLFAYISERTEEIISGKQYPFNVGQFMNDIVRGIWIACRNLFLETVWMLLLFIFAFFPVIGWLGGIPFFILSAYFYGFSFMDYTSERRKMKVAQSVEFVRAYKWLAIANGSLFSLFLLIPFCGVFLSGFAAIVSVTAATLAVNEIAPVSRQMSGKNYF